MQRLVKGALSMPRGLSLRNPSAFVGAAAKRAAACSAWRQLTFVPASTQLVGPGNVAGAANHNRWWCQQRGGGSHKRSLSSASLPFGDVPVEELVKKADVAKVRAELEGMSVQKISTSDFCASCAKYGITGAEALNLLSAFHTAGVVLNFSSSSSIALRETVFIKPKDVLDSVWATLDVTSASTTKELLAKEKELAILKSEFRGLSETKKVLDAVAYKRADAKIWLGSLIPITAFSTLFRMTYWEFSWDIVEPISFFVSTMGPIVFFYLWFAKHKTDFSMRGWHQTLVERAQASIYESKLFDIDRHNVLIEAIRCVEEDIQALKQG